MSLEKTLRRHLLVFIDSLEEKPPDNLCHGHCQSDSVHLGSDQFFLDACSGTDSYVIDRLPEKNK